MRRRSTRSCRRTRSAGRRSARRDGESDRLSLAGRCICILRQALREIDRCAASLLFLAALGWLPAPRGADAELVAAPFDAAHWELDGGDIGFATYLGEPALRDPSRQRRCCAARHRHRHDRVRHRLSRPSASSRAFTSAAARTADWEYFYLRPHKNSGWDLEPAHAGHRRRGDLAALFRRRLQQHRDLQARRLETASASSFHPTSADVFINGVRSLRIPELKSSSTHGFLAVDSAAGAGNTTGQCLLRQLPLPLWRRTHGLPTCRRRRPPTSPD